nr:hypothetical protein [Candidatus Freyarchaeota archaeon]
MTNRQNVKKILLSLTLFSLSLLIITPLGSNAIANNSNLCNILFLPTSISAANAAPKALTTNQTWYYRNTFINSTTNFTGSFAYVQKNYGLVNITDWNGSTQECYNLTTTIDIIQASLAFGGSPPENTSSSTLTIWTYLNTTNYSIPRVDSEMDQIFTNGTSYKMFMGLLFNVTVYLYQLPLSDGLSWTSIANTSASGWTVDTTGSNSSIPAVYEDLNVSASVTGPTNVTVPAGTYSSYQLNYTQNTTCVLFGYFMATQYPSINQVLGWYSSDVQNFAKIFFDFGSGANMTIELLQPSGSPGSIPTGKTWTYLLTYRNSTFTGSFIYTQTNEGIVSITDWNGSTQQCYNLTSTFDMMKVISAMGGSRPTNASGGTGKIWTYLNTTNYSIPRVDTEIDIAYPNGTSAKAFASFMFNITVYLYQFPLVDSLSWTSIANTTLSEWMVDTSGSNTTDFDSGDFNVSASVSGPTNITVPAGTYSSYQLNYSLNTIFVNFGYWMGMTLGDGATEFLGWYSLDAQNFAKIFIETDAGSNYTIELVNPSGTPGSIPTGKTWTYQFTYRNSTFTGSFTYTQKNYGLVNIIDWYGNTQQCYNLTTTIDMMKVISAMGGSPPTNASGGTGKIWTYVNTTDYSIPRVDSEIDIAFTNGTSAKQFASFMFNITVYLYQFPLVDSLSWMNIANTTLSEWMVDTSGSNTTDFDSGDLDIGAWVSGPTSVTVPAGTYTCYQLNYSLNTIFVHFGYLLGMALGDGATEFLGWYSLDAQNFAKIFIDMGFGENVTIELVSEAQNITPLLLLTFLNAQQQQGFTTLLLIGGGVAAVIVVAGIAIVLIKRRV